MLFKEILHVSTCFRKRFVNLQFRNVFSKCTLSCAAQMKEYDLVQWFSKVCLLTSIIHHHLETQQKCRIFDTVQTYWIRNLGRMFSNLYFNKPFWWFWYILMFENHHFKTRIFYPYPHHTMWSWTSNLIFFF